VRGVRIDPLAVQKARALFQSQSQYEQFPLEPEEKFKPEEKSTGSVILGELIAIFPGLLVHGLGHYYAGDYQTARRLRHVGELGYVMTALGGGLVVGGYYLGKEDLKGFSYSLYGVGGTIGVAGVFYLLTAWVYDMIDTPRAVSTGGEPPPRSEFIDSLDIFE
jgi:hypothetical protein